MPRRFITREDVIENAQDGVLMIGPNDVITAAAEDIASRRKISIQREGEAAQAPALPPAAAFSAARRSESAAPTGAHVIIAAVGRNRPRVLSEITTRLAELDANILDISQTIVRGYFSLLLIAEVSDIATDFKTFKERLEQLSRDGDYRLTVQHEDVFRAMQRI